MTYIVSSVVLNSTPIKLEGAPEIDTNPTSFYRGGV